MECAFVESNYHCDLNQKAPHGCFSVESQQVSSFNSVDPVHPVLCTLSLIAVYIDKATDTTHARAFRTSTILYTAGEPRSGE